MDKLHTMAEALIKYETIDEEQIKDIMAGREPRPPADWTDNGPPPMPSEAEREPRSREGASDPEPHRGPGQPALTPLHLQLRTRRLDLGTPVVMGVLNVTPDSFSDGGRFDDLPAAVARARRMAAEGAALLDIGGESTRPGAPPVDVGEELVRVMPVIEAVAGSGAPPVSVDTAKPEVMTAAAAAGAEMINDVRALGVPGALEAAAASGCAVCLMHMQGEPRTMQQAPAYGDVVEEVYAFLAARIEACVRAGHRPGSHRRRPGLRLRQDAGAQSGADEASRALRPARTGAAAGRRVEKIHDRAVTGRPVGERLAGGLALAALAVGGRCAHNPQP
jgi:dihydropteroate synthase